MAIRPTRLSKTVIRTKRDGCFRILSSPCWGKVLVESDDPEGEILSEEEIHGIQLAENFPRLPSTMWSAWLNLVFHYCSEQPQPRKSRYSRYSRYSSLFSEDRSLEVECLFLRKEDDPTQWKMVVPKQVVSGVSVDAEFDECIDLITGEEYTQFPPEGYMHAGSTHSHNTMKAFFSSTDDEHELGVPGMHIVVGEVDIDDRTYNTAASVVLSGERKLLEVEELVDITWNDTPFHPDVLNYITKEKPKSKTRYISSFKDWEDRDWEVENNDEEESPTVLVDFGDGEYEEVELDDIDFDDSDMLSDEEARKMIEDELVSQGRSPAEVDDWVDELFARTMRSRVRSSDSLQW